MKKVFASITISVLALAFVGCSSPEETNNVKVMKPTDPGYAPPGISSSQVGNAGGSAPAPSGGATQAPSTE